MQIFREWNIEETNQDNRPISLSFFLRVIRDEYKEKIIQVVVMSTDRHYNTSKALIISEKQ